ncbi:hypothetical protein GF376_03315 [Candidatus Peregrinibacteria bacterium]|nr:hypothetical protein [Candidatus Peregrinibacteria bacterium]
MTNIKLCLIVIATLFFVACGDSDPAPIYPDGAGGGSAGESGGSDTTGGSRAESGGSTGDSPDNNGGSDSGETPAYEPDSTPQQDPPEPEAEPAECVSGLAEAQFAAFDNGCGSASVHVLAKDEHGNSTLFEGSRVVTADGTLTGQAVALKELETVTSGEPTLPCKPVYGAAIMNGHSYLDFSSMTYVYRVEVPDGPASVRLDVATQALECLDSTVCDVTDAGLPAPEFVKGGLQYVSQVCTEEIILWKQADYVISQ